MGGGESLRARADDARLAAAAAGFAARRSPGLRLSLSLSHYASGDALRPCRMASPNADLPGKSPGLCRHGLGVARRQALRARRGAGGSDPPRRGHARSGGLLPPTPRNFSDRPSAFLPRLRPVRPHGGPRLVSPSLRLGCLELSPAEGCGMGTKPPPGDLRHPGGTDLLAGELRALRDLVRGVSSSRFHGRRGGYSVLCPGERLCLCDRTHPGSEPTVRAGGRTPLCLYPRRGHPRHHGQERHADCGHLPVDGGADSRGEKSAHTSGQKLAALLAGALPGDRNQAHHRFSRTRPARARALGPKTLDGGKRKDRR